MNNLQENSGLYGIPNLLSDSLVKLVSGTDPKFTERGDERPKRLFRAQLRSAKIGIAE